MATASQKSVNIWNYAKKTLEINHTVQSGEIPQAVAFHPSGFHLLVGFPDRIQLMNVLSESLKDGGQPIQIKNSREIRFAHGGHLFAAATPNYNIQIHNFFTLDCPSYYQCKGHSQ